MGVPRQLPVAPAAFVNRDAVRAAIGEECRRAHADGRPAFVALYGAGGVGVKSAVWKWYWEDPVVSRTVRWRWNWVTPSMVIRRR